MGNERGDRLNFPCQFSGLLTDLQAKAGKGRLTGKDGNGVNWELDVGRASLAEEKIDICLKK